MTRALYAYCTKPDFPERIRAFERELGWEPVAVITSAANRQGLAEAYPDIPVHDKDEFSKVVCPIRRAPLSSRAVAEDYAYIQPFAASVMGMMERTALPDRFTFRERKRYLRCLVHEIGSVLDELAPDVVHFDEAPHGTAYMVFYHLAKRRGIPTVWFTATGFTGHNLVSDTLCAAPLHRTAVGEGAEAQDVPVPDAMFDKVESMRASEKITHWYMEVQEATAAQPPAPVASSIDYRKLLLLNRWPVYVSYAWVRIKRPFDARKAARQRAAWLDQPNEAVAHFQLTPVNDRPVTNRDYEESLEQRRRCKAELAAAYGSMSDSDVPLDAPFVYFPLHFQPERTTNPEGGNLDDQLVAVATLHDALPEGWLLYVKEHPTQFHPNPLYAGEKGRSATDYEELRSLPRVRLVGLDVPSTSLVRASRAVVTITGTAAWEAAVNGVPGIHMAHAWYEGFPGTLFAPGFSEVEGFFASYGSYEQTTPQAEQAFLRRFLAAAFPYEVAEQDLPAGTFAPGQQAAGAVAAMRWWQGLGR